MSACVSAVLTSADIAEQHGGESQHVTFSGARITPVCVRELHLKHITKTKHETPR